MEEPGPENKPTEARSLSILFWKKAISYLMSNKLESWNSRSKEGNPTRSIKANKLVKRVKKKEVWKQGAPSKAQQALKTEEYEMIIGIL